LIVSAVRPEVIQGEAGRRERLALAVDGDQELGVVGIAVRKGRGACLVAGTVRTGRELGTVVTTAAR
jgi:hypothetical protein